MPPSLRFDLDAALHLQQLSVAAERHQIHARGRPRQSQAEERRDRGGGAASKRTLATGHCGRFFRSIIAGLWDREGRRPSLWGLPCSSRTRLGRIRKGCYSPALARGFSGLSILPLFEANGKDGRCIRQAAVTPLLVHLGFRKRLLAALVVRQRRGPRGGRRGFADETDRGPAGVGQERDGEDPGRTGSDLASVGPGHST